MAISQLIEQTIAQHISNPRVLSYAPSKLNEVTGRFVASNRVYNFVLDKKGISYSPAGQGDSLLFSALYLRQDAARKPKVGNDRCNAGKSYQCGQICLGNRRKCHKGVRDVNDARRIASILESTNEMLKNKVGSEVSDKARARGKALFEARGERVRTPKAKPDDSDALNRLEQLFRLGRGEEIESSPKQKNDLAQKKLNDLKYKSGDRIKRGTEVYYSMDYGDGGKEINFVTGVVTGSSKDGETVSIKRTGKGENEGKIYKAPIEKLFKSLDAKKAYKEAIESSREYHKFESKNQAVKRRSAEVGDRKEWVEENLKRKIYSSKEPPKKGTIAYYAMNFGDSRSKDSYSLIKGSVVGVSNNGQTVSIKRLDKGENEGRIYKAPTWQLFKSLDTQSVAHEYEDLQNYIWHGTPIPERRSRLADKGTTEKAMQNDLISQSAKTQIKPINPTNVSTIINTIKNPSTTSQRKQEYVEVLKTALPKMRESKKFQGYSSVAKVEEVLKQHTKN